MYSELTKKIDKLLENKSIVLIGIDGKCASGKTTLADKLGTQFDCNIFHMDDFFLRPEQRTPERFGEIGGNADYERFNSEVILPVLSGKKFSYRPYNCKTADFKPPINVTPRKLNIVEGSYALHPFNAKYFDLSVCLTVSEWEQHRRILKRNPQSAEDFFTKWIPLENKYFVFLRDNFKFDILIDNTF